MSRTQSLKTGIKTSTATWMTKIAIFFLSVILSLPPCFFLFFFTNQCHLRQVGIHFPEHTAYIHFFFIVLSSYISFFSYFSTGLVQL